MCLSIVISNFSLQKEVFAFSKEPLECPTAHDLRLQNQPPMLALQVQWDQLVLIAENDDGILSQYYIIL